MYEVFFNDRCLVIAGAHEKANFNTGLEVGVDSKLENPDEIIRSFLEGNARLVVLRGNPEEIWKRFKSYFKEVPAAGGIVKSSEGFLFIFRHGRWDLPKGKIDKGETPEQAALREVREETGLQRLHLAGVLPSTWHIYYSPYDSEGSKPVLKETRWFMMEPEDLHGLAPETKEGITELRWFKNNELGLATQNTYGNLKGLIARLRQ